MNSICPVAGVRKNSLMVLTHLIMNDMMKVKGHIARMALCLQDPHPRIKDLAHLFFHELAQKNYKVTAGAITQLPLFSHCARACTPRHSLKHSKPLTLCMSALPPTIKSYHSHSCFRGSS